MPCRPLPVIVLAIAILILASCSNKPQSQQSPLSVKRSFETTIARQILGETRQQLLPLKGSARAAFLRQQLEKFDRSIDLSLVSRQVFRQYELLIAMTALEQVRWHADEFHARIRGLTSLAWTLEDYEHHITAEIVRIDAAVMEVSGRDSAELPMVFADARATARYPDDSDNGRQQYLDEVINAMVDVQQNWPDLFETYESSVLNLAGTEAAESAFWYNQGTLTVNIGRVTDLPDFELAAIAVYYGYPGQQSFAEHHEKDNLQSAVELPAYNLGWAGYILDQLTSQMSNTPIGNLYFSKLLAVLALADLRLNTGAWTIDEAVSYINDSTPYDKHRIRLMLNRAIHDPGYHLAGVAGKLRFDELKTQCLDRSPDPADCHQAFHQQVLDLGPIPFDQLESQLVWNRLAQ